MPAFSIDPEPGGYRATFWADNGTLIWATRVLKREFSAELAVELIKRHAASAPVIDRTRRAS